MAEKTLKDTAFKTSQEAAEDTAPKKKTTRTTTKKAESKTSAAKKTTKAKTETKEEIKEELAKVDEAEEEIAKVEAEVLASLTTDPEETADKQGDEADLPATSPQDEKETPSEDASIKEAVKEEVKPAKKPKPNKRRSKRPKGAKKNAAKAAGNAPADPKNEKVSGSSPKPKEQNKKEAVKDRSPQERSRAPRRVRRRLKPYSLLTMEEKQQGARREIRNTFGEKTNSVKETMVGLPSEDIYRANQQFMISDEEREQNLYRELIRYQKYSEILWGTLVSAEVDYERNVVYACVLWNDIIVKIPDYLFFEPTYRFGVTYDRMSEGEKLTRRHSTITFMLGAKVCFIVADLNRELIRDRYDVMYDTYEMTVEGNRCRAMQIMRDIFFFHENRKDTTRGVQREIKEGDILNARIVQVKEESILVECGGVETRIAAALLSARDYYTNCTDAYSAGDMIKVRVKKVYVDPVLHTVHLSLTGQVINPAKAIKDMKIGSAYLGTVRACNEDRHTYTVMLSNGVPCTVLFEFVFGHIPLVKGDKVRVTVSKIYNEKGVSFVSGAAQKL